MSFFRSTRRAFLEQNGTQNESDHFWPYTNNYISPDGIPCPFVRCSTLNDQLQYLRISFQQHRLLTPPRLSLILCPLFALSSTLAMIALTLSGTFYLYSVHLGGLFTLVINYVGAAWWYWWLVGQMTEGRAKVRRISYHVSAMTFFLLTIAIMGTVWRSWIIALEVSYSHFRRLPGNTDSIKGQLCVIIMWTTFLQIAA